MVRQAGQKSSRAKPTGSDDVIRQVMAERHARSSHKLTENKLREAEHKFRTIFMAGPYALSLVTQKEGRIIDVNPSYAGTFGYSREEMIGRTVRELGIWAD